MPEQTVIEAVRDTMRAEMRRDESVILLGEDVGLRGGVFLATDGFIEEFGEDRVIDTPLAESLICGLALGAAVNGMRPLAEIPLIKFQVRQQAIPLRTGLVLDALHKCRGHGPVVVRGVGEGGGQSGQHRPGSRPCRPNPRT